MKKYLLASFLLFEAEITIAQKKVIDETAFTGWSVVSQPVEIGEDGNYVFYTIDSVGRRLVIQSTGNKWKLEIAGANEPFFLHHGTKVIYKTPDNRICILNLKHREIVSRPNVQSYRIFSFKGNDCIAILKYDGGLDLVTGDNILIKSFNHVTDYSISNDGDDILLQTRVQAKGNTIAAIQWWNLSNDQSDTIWKSEKACEISWLSFDMKARQAMFVVSVEENGISRSSVWYCKREMRMAQVKLNNCINGMPEGCDVYEVKFSLDGQRLIIKLKKNKVSSFQGNHASVDVWNYKDDKLQPQQLSELDDPWFYFVASFDLTSHHLIILVKEDERLFENSSYHSDSLLLVTTVPCYSAENSWRSSCRLPLYLVNTKNGERTLVKSDMLFSERNGLSPDGNFVLYYDYDTKSYYSYNIRTGSTINITKEIPYPIYDRGTIGTTLPHPYSRLPNCWLLNKRKLVIYDQYDVWLVDPAGIQKPVSLTNGYGRRKGIVFRSLNLEVTESDVTLLAFRVSDKANGFYAINLKKLGDPRRLCLDQCLYYWPEIDLSGQPRPLKATKSNVWMLQRMTASEAPNFVITRDFLTFQRLTDIQPQTAYNWLTGKLHEWTTFDGKIAQGILYKPENFDSTRKYPVILHFYGKRSDGLNNFLLPGFTGHKINIPYFVSNGYLVFDVDIQIDVGEPVQGIYNSVGSAAQYISRFIWVDSSKLGLYGHSFGGYEVNALISRTSMFSAAAEAAGLSDHVSAYNQIQDPGVSRQFHYETGQTRIGATLWERPDLYIKASPIFYADKVTTPLLMQNNIADPRVPFSQGVEFFTALRRLDKPVWMLQYDHSQHQLNIEDARDYTVRLQQFFDHYLKSAPAPVWMTRGVPARLKQIETGYAYDPTASCSNDCDVCRIWNEKMRIDSARGLDEIRRKTLKGIWQ